MNMNLLDAKDEKATVSLKFYTLPAKIVIDRALRCGIYRSYFRR